MSREEPVCPHCSNPLIYRDTRTRIWKWYGGIKRHIRIRRLRCSSCQRYHTELPDVLVPNKHYGSEVIENVADDVSTPDDKTTEDYPCTKTMERWKDWIAANTPQIDGYLKSIGTRFLDMPESLLASKDSLLTSLRDLGAGWLRFTTAIIYRTGGSFLPSVRVHKSAPALSVCPRWHDVSLDHKEDNRHEYRNHYHLAGRNGPAPLSTDSTAPG